MAAVRAAQGESTRRAILHTARTLFRDRGFDATSLQLIADTMGVTKANVYYYFRTKIAILEALLEPTVARVAAGLDDAEKIEDRTARIEFLIADWIDQVVTSYRTLAPMSRSDPIMRRHPDISRRLNELAERGLHLVFGADPTPDQQAAYWQVRDLGVVIRRLDGLPDDELCGVLDRLCRRVILGASVPQAVPRI